MSDYESGMLVAAVNAHDRDRAAELLRLGAPADEADERGESALIKAVWEFELDLIQLLLEHGADPNFESPRGNRPLCAHPNLTGRMVKTLLEAGADPLVDGRHGRPLLYEIALRSTKRVLKAVFDAGFSLQLSEAEQESLVAELRACKAPTLPLVLEHLGRGEPADDKPGRAKKESRATRWSEVAGSAAFQALVGEFETQLGRASRGWKRRKAVRHFPKVALGERLASDSEETSLAADDPELAARLLRRLSEGVAPRGGLLIANDLLFDEPCSLLLFPTEDKYEVLSEVGSNGANYGHDAEGVINWLKEMERENPFHLYAATHDGLEGAFLQPVQNATGLASRMLDFCPDVDGRPHDQAVAGLAEDLETSGGFTLWWD